MVFKNNDNDNDNDKNNNKKIKKYIWLYQGFPCPFANGCMISLEQYETLATNNNPTLSFYRRIIAVWGKQSRKIVNVLKFLDLKKLKSRFHGNETNSDSNSWQWHHKYPLPRSYILFTLTTWGECFCVPTVVCPLSLQVANVLVTFLTRLKLAVRKDIFSKVGIEIELTLPHLFFILFVEHCDFAGRFIRDLLILLWTK